METARQKGGSDASWLEQPSEMVGKSKTPGDEGVAATLVYRGLWMGSWV